MSRQLSAVGCQPSAVSCRPSAAPARVTRVLALLCGVALVGGFAAAPTPAHAAGQARLTAPQGGCVAASGRRSAPRDCAAALLAFWPRQAGDKTAYAPALAEPLCRTTLTLQRAATAGLLAVNGGAIATSMVPLAPLPGCSSSQWSAAPIAWQTVGRAQHRHYRRRQNARPAGAVLALQRQAGRATPRASSGALHLPAYQPLGASSGSPVDTGGMLMLAGKFVLVLALLFVCLRVLRAVMPRLSGNATRGGIVLHTEAIGAKQSIQVLDLGTRIVVIGLTGTSMAALTTIDDEEEMAAVRARYGPKGPMRSAAREHPAEPRAATPGPVKPAEAPAEQATDERPTFAQALAIAMSRSLGRGEPARPGATPAKKAGSQAPARKEMSATGSAIRPGTSTSGARRSGAVPTRTTPSSLPEQQQQSHDESPLGRSLDAIRALRRKYEES